MTTLFNDSLDVATTPDGDIDVGPEGLRLIGGIDGVVQLCRILLRLTAGEWFLNLDKGIEWYEYLGAKLDQVDVLRAELSTKILLVPNVVEVVSMAIIITGRRIAVQWEVLTVFGNTGLQTTTL